MKAYGLFSKRNSASEWNLRGIFIDSKHPKNPSTKCLNKAEEALSRWHDVEPHTQFKICLVEGPNSSTIDKGWPT